MHRSEYVPRGGFAFALICFSLWSPATHENISARVALANIKRGRTHSKSRKNIIKCVFLQDLVGWSLGL